MGKGKSRRRLLAIGSAAVVAGVAILAGWWFAPAQRQARLNAALTEAAARGDVAAIRAAVDRGADVNARDADGVTPLMHAARGHHPRYEDPSATDHPETVALLIDRGAEVNARTGAGFVALFWAAKYGHAGVVRVLIAGGADVNATDDYGETALKGAARQKDEAIIRQLKEAGAKE